MDKEFALAISSLRKGYAVVCVSAENQEESILTASYHEFSDVTDNFLFIKFYGDEDEEEYLLDLIDEELGDHEVTDDLFLVSTKQILDFIEIIVSELGAQAIHVEGSLIDQLQSERILVHERLLSDIRKNRAETHNKILRTYLPYVNSIKDYFAVDSNKRWLRNTVQLVYFMNRTSSFARLTSDFQKANDSSKRLRSYNLNTHLFPRHLNPYALAISAFGYRSEDGVTYIGAYSISNSIGAYSISNSKDKTKRENWADIDLAVYGALRTNGGALEAMAYRYKCPPNPQNHQLALLPFNDLIPGGVRFYSNVGIERYLKEWYPHIPYKEIEFKQLPFELDIEMGVVKDRYWPKSHRDMVDDFMNP